jgi:hypothetical protein
MKTKCVECSREWSGIRAAHCSQCHHTFTTPNAFDAHQFLKPGGVTCRDPSSVGLVYVDWRDAYRFMNPDEEKDSASIVPA